MSQKSCLTLITALSVLFVLSACQTTHPVAVEADEPIADEMAKPSVEWIKDDTATVFLTLDQTVQIRDKKVDFMRLNGDSRCPKGVECIQTGNAQVMILVSSDTAAETLQLNTDRKLDSEKGQTFENMHFALLDVTPYPATNVRIDPSQIEIELIVSVIDYSIEPLVIDVRSDKEYAESHVERALHVPYKDIADVLHVYGIDKGRDIILYCRSGGRAGKAKEVLDALGYTDVTNGLNQQTVENMLDDSSENQ